MNKYECKNLVFSSSATVYGDPEIVPITEDFPVSATNPYGRTKLFIEEILRDLSKSDNTWKIVILRYFNPIGAHESGLIGEQPQGVPNNLMPFISQVAIGKRDKLSVFGGDYPTIDGTGVRDYIHVMDLSDAHLKSIQIIKDMEVITTLNIGTGSGVSVLQMINEFEAISGKKIAFDIVARRDGDIAECWADASLATRIIEWKPERDIKDMIQDTWRWQRDNPNGY